MKKIDIKSLIIGVLGTIIIFLAMGATSQNNNMGDITATSVNIVDENGRLVCIMDSYNNAGTLALIGANREPMIMLVCEPEGGSIHTNNANNKSVTYLGTSSNGFGMLTLNNKDDSRAVYLGGSISGEGGIINTYGKKYINVALGTSDGGNGSLTLYNDIMKDIVYLGDNTANSGMLDLTDRNSKRTTQLNSKQLLFKNNFNEKIMILGNADESGFIGIGDKSGKLIWGKN